MTLPGQEARDAELISAFEQTKKKQESLHTQAINKMRKVWCVFKDQLKF